MPEDIASTLATPADRLRHAHAARLGVAALEAFLPAASREGFAGKAHDKMRRQDRAKAHFKVALDTLATADQLTHHKSGDASLSALSNAKMHQQDRAKQHFHAALDTRQASSREADMMHAMSQLRQKPRRRRRKGWSNSRAALRR